MTVLYLCDPRCQQQLLYLRFGLLTPLDHLRRPVEDDIPGQSGRVSGQPGHEPGQATEALVEAGGVPVGEGAGTGDVILVGAEGESDLHLPRHPTGRLDPHRVTGDQLALEGNQAEHHLHPLLEVVPYDDNGLAANGPALTGGDGDDPG